VAAPDAWAGKTDLIKPPAPKPPAAVELPKIDQYKLANGLQVFIIKSDRLPVVSYQLAVRAGRMHEPRTRLGVAEATADMLVKGTKKRDAAAIAKTIDFVGGTIAADATFEATLLSCSVLSKNQATCLDLMPDMLTSPTFPDAELVKVKESLLAQVRQRLDDASALASAHVQNLLWGNDHVRGWIPSEGTVAALKRDDLVAFHKAWFVPGNTILVVTGDVDPKKLKGDLERTFGQWAKGPVPPAPSYKEPDLSGSRIRIVDKPGQTQTHIRIAQFGIKHQDPRFFDSLVWNYALGGGAFSSRLMKVVRVNGGKTYGASSSFDRNLDKGSFVASTFTRNSEAVATTKLILGEIANMAKEGPTQAEVDAAVANIAGGYGMRFQAASDVGAALIGAELHDFGEGYLQNFPLAVGKVDVASAKRAAAEILDPRAYVIVMVGDAKDLVPQLDKAGWRYEKVAFSEPITPEVVAPPAPVDPKQVDAARKTIEDALVAKGGRAKLAALKSIRMVASGDTTIQGQTVPVETERTFVLPDKIRIDALLMQKVKVVIAVSGSKGWQIGPDPKTGQQAMADFGGDDVKPIDFERWREPELLLLKASDKAAVLKPQPDETIDGKPQTVISLASPFGIDLVLYLDKKTKLLTRVAYNQRGDSETDDFSEYKDVKGIKVAFKRRSSGTGAGARSTDLVIKTVEFDGAIDPKLFDKPAGP
jgi:zinc protease